MTYKDCLQYLDRLGDEVLTMKLGLENIRRLLAALGDPQLHYRAILVGGTVGKGSVARFVHGALSACGIRTGLYTSPHLVRIEERIQIGESPISSHEFAEAFSSTFEALSSLGQEFHPTFFETVTATAFLHFARRHVDIVVLEVGLGGRLDSTNVVSPTVSVLAPIGLDHQNILGDRLEQIAWEKAGILHPGVPVVTTRQAAEVLQVIESVALERGCPVTQVETEGIESSGTDEGHYRFEWMGHEFRLSCLGAHQVENAILALEVVRRLQEEADLDLSEEAVRSGIERTRHAAVLRKISDHPVTLVDGGHNPDAAERLRAFMLAHTLPPRNLVLGMMRDKQIRAFYEILEPCFESVYLAPVKSPRAARVEDLKRLIPEGLISESPASALREARDSARTVLVAGSFYLAGETLKALGVLDARGA